MSITTTTITGNTLIDNEMIESRIVTATSVFGKRIREHRNDAAMVGSLGSDLVLLNNDLRYLFGRFMNNCRNIIEMLLGEPPERDWKALSQHFMTCMWLRAQLNARVSLLNDRIWQLPDDQLLFCAEWQKVFVEACKVMDDRMTLVQNDQCFQMSCLASPMVFTVDVQTVGSQRMVPCAHATIQLCTHGGAVVLK